MPNEKTNAGGTDTEERSSFEDLLASNMREFGGGLPEEEMDAGLTNANRNVDGETDSDGDYGESQEDTTERDEAPVPRRASRSGRPGIDEILNHLETTMPGATDVVRGMQSETNRVINRLDTMERRMDEESAARAMPGPEVAEEDEEVSEFEPSEAQLRLIERAAGRLGLVRQDKLDADEAADEQASYVTNALQEGVERYGDSFGTDDGEGNITLNPELQEKIDPVMDRVKTRGLTPLDLAVLAGTITPEEAEEQRTRDDAEDLGRGRGRGGRPSRRTNTVGRSLPRTRTQPDLRAGDNGDDPDTVFDRAWQRGRSRVRPRRR
jgi:hypothetical protein